MRNPLWIINSILAICLLAIVIFIGFSLKKIVKPAEIPCITPAKTPTLAKEEKTKPQDIRLIYENNDLFGTYKTETTAPEIIKVPDVPNPPAPKPMPAAQELQVQFLEPLAMKISGIISSNNESKSQVTLVDTKTGDSSSYRVGDKLFDAYILRIFSRKIIVIRSNGQQDTIFMYQEDAEREIQELKESSWVDVVKKLSDTDFEINRDNFVARILSLAKFIDMLDLTTAFKNGDSIGSKIGNMDKKSIGNSLSLIPGDIILSIEGIAPTNTENRLDIYSKVNLAKHNDIIKVELLRGNTKLTYNYHIKANQEIKEEDKKQIKTALNKEQNILEAVKTIKRKQNIALASKEFKRKDRYAMSKHGGKDAPFKYVKLG